LMQVQKQQKVFHYIYVLKRTLYQVAKLIL
jgi:hypothetical protein